jgi:chromosome segregation protein
MKPNRIYQATVEALESALAPRVVSLVLRQALTQAGRAPAEMALEDVESVLTEFAFRHLQTLMPAEQARSAVATLRERIASQAAGDGEGPELVAEEEPAAAAGDAPAPERDDADDDAGKPSEAGGRERIDALRAALRPFNLYFDWPEVRKLRALIQVAEAESSAGRDASASLAEAADQLQLVEQKLEDRLVLQARELGELEEALEIVASLGGPRVRRLEALIGQISQAQRDRELAEGEVHRAAGLARDLRKLMETSVAVPAAERIPAPLEGEGQAERADDETAPVSIDDAVLTPEASERLRRLDIDAERKQLDALEARHAELLRYLPSLSTRLTAARAELDRERPLGGELAALRQALDDATGTQRAQLAQELEALAAQLEELGDEDPGLGRAITVALELLQEGLPPFADVTALRERQRAALDRSEERARREADARAHHAAKRRQQRAVLERLAQACDRDSGAATYGLVAPRQALRDALEAVREAEAADRLDEPAVQRAQLAEQRWERALAERADGEQERLHARLRELGARLTMLPDLPALRARTVALRREVSDALEREGLDEAHAVALASLIDQLHADAVTEYARQLDALAKDAGEVSSANVLRALQAAARELEGGRFGDLSLLRDLVAEEREEARERDQGRWQRLQQAYGRLESAGVPGVPALAQALDDARGALGVSGLADRALAEAEAALEVVEAEVRARLRSFGPRLDAALETFWRVERLNNDDVATVRRVLTHLDSQRDALGRVSPGLQHQLERALAGSERLLEQLAEAFEATRAVADQLVAGNLLDDMLAGFDAWGAEAGVGGDGTESSVGDARTEGTHDARAEGAAGAWADDARVPGSGGTTGGEPLAALIDDLRGLDDVLAAAVIGEDGTVHAGDLAPFDEARLLEALRGAARSWGMLGRPFEDAPEFVELGLGDAHALLAPLGRGSHALLGVRGDGAISALGARLRRERQALSDALGTWT